MNPLTPDPWTGRLSEYVDGELSPAEREACESHLAGCAECARLLEELKAVVARAGSLPAAPPPADLWAGIEARLETPVLQMRPRAALRESWARRWSFSSLQLGAAAAALVAVTAGVMWLALPRGAAPTGGSPDRRLATRVPEAGTAPAGDTSIASPDAVDPAAVEGGFAAIPIPAPHAGSSREAAVREMPNAAVASLDPDRPAPNTPADFGVGRYDAAIAELEAALDAKRTRLNPETVRIVEANLATVDKAIAEARSALAADPASRYLNAHLASTMRRKVDLLRRLNSLARV